MLTIPSFNKQGACTELDLLLKVVYVTDSTKYQVKIKKKL